MDRFAFSARSIAWIGLLTFVGCGPAKPTSENSSEPPADNVAVSVETKKPAAVPTNDAVRNDLPTHVVSQFLDEVRRGGEDVRANELLTQQAQSVLKQIGQSVHPIGSPDARFQVTRYEPVPNEPNSALVHSIWSEPNGDGSNSDFQVVWAVEKEKAGWRISGLAMELDVNQPPLIIDFENAQLMANLLAAPGATGEAPPQIATQPGEENGAIFR